LSSRLKEKEEKFLKIIDSLSEESENGIPILVEGKKDVRALRKLGIKGLIITIKTRGKTFLDVISKIKKLELKKVILLLDFDKRGKEGTRCLQNNLEHNKINYNINYWFDLIALTSKEIQFIESLDVYLLNLAKKSMRQRRI
jgi:2,5-diamino-6-(ribosylamino)-4(3H)-pyrimidinone 5'-phosphate reductase